MLLRKREVRKHRGKNGGPWGIGRGFREEVTFDLDLDSKVGVGKMDIYALNYKGITCQLHAHFKSTHKNIDLLNLITIKGI